MLAIDVVLGGLLPPWCEGTAVWLYALRGGIADYAVYLDITIAGLDQAAQGRGVVELEFKIQ